MENNIYICEESFIKGSEGEKVTYQWFKNNPKISKIYDTRYSGEYQDIDVDFVVETISGNRYNIEVKTDSYTTGRLCYEIMSCIETGSLGCMRKSKADWLFYYYPVWDKMYVFDFPRFKSWCEANLETIGIKFNKKTQTKRYDGSVYTTDNRYFELKELEKHDFCKIYENFSFGY